MTIPLALLELMTCRASFLFILWTHPGPYTPFHQGSIHAAELRSSALAASAAIRIDPSCLPGASVPRIS